MLKKIRLILAALFFAFITLLFLDFSGTIHAWFGWMAKIQFIPALLAINVGVLVGLLLLTIVFGRLYCSVICPLGVFQDIVARVGKIGRKLPYTYSKPLNWLRWSFLGVFILAIILGISVIVSLLDPYASYGRIANNLFQPLWLWSNNLLAFIAERFDSYTFYSVDVWMKSIPALITAIAIFLVVGFLAWKNGRTYCNTVCPVGTILGFFSKYSLFKITIDEKKCNKCSLCARNCKAACINYTEYNVDNSRCVTCMNCIDKCNKGAIEYKFNMNRSKSNRDKVEDILEPLSDSKKENGRRGFIASTLILAGASVKAQIVPKATDIKMDGGLADITDKKESARKTRITPAGSLSANNLKSRCTSCQLCISVCPNQVLRPSSDLATFMQPYMSYEKGYCRPECTICTDVCPTGAITKIGKEDKSSIQIGHAVWVKDTCIPLADKQECDNCARHCPTAAIVMIPSIPENKESLKIPAVNVERCIGCGACENLCPSTPYSAIYVEGHENHRVI